MNNVYALHILPTQQAINSIASYHLEFEKEPLDYRTLLGKLKKAIYELDFICKHDNADWLRNRGSDFLANPKLFSQAPLTYLCAFLSEIFKKYDLSELQEKLSPAILKCLLTRLEEFRVD